MLDSFIQEAKDEVMSQDLTGLTPNQVIDRIALLAEEKLLVYERRIGTSRGVETGAVSPDADRD